MFDLKASRLEAGLTQAELAHRSGVSLPTVQNIEAGRANPAWQTLAALADAVGLEAKWIPKPVDWDLLAVCGAPLTVSSPPTVRPTAALLRQELLAACRAITLPNSGVPERYREAVLALLGAVKSHFPTFYSRNLRSPLTQVLEGELNSPRLIRLRRMAVAVIAEYL